MICHPSNCKKILWKVKVAAGNTLDGAVLADQLASMVHELQTNRYQTLRNSQEGGTDDNTAGGGVVACRRAPRCDISVRLALEYFVLKKNPGVGNVSGRGGLTETETDNVSGKGRLTETATATDNVSGRGRLTETATYNVSGRERLTETETDNVSGRGRLTETTTDNVSGRGRLTETETDNVSGRGRLTETDNVSGRGRLTETATDNVSGRGRLTETDNVSGRGRLTETDNVSGRGRLTETDNVSGRGRLTETATDKVILYGLMTVRASGSGLECQHQMLNRAGPRAPSRRNASSRRHGTHVWEGQPESTQFVASCAVGSREIIAAFSSPRTVAPACGDRTKYIGAVAAEVQCLL
ncbi:hypothetical protein LSAT2_020943 [Lamellibrachia satsuma]|nr:hypothetical protein LSAT2_020943 [Lamellibrachia satsuma]